MREKRSPRYLLFRLYLVAVATATTAVTPTISAAVTASASTVASAAATGTAGRTTSTAAASAVASTASATTFFAWLGDIHRKRAAVHLLIVERFDGRIGLWLVRHLDESEPARPTGFPIRHHLGSCHCPVLLKHRVQVIRCGGPGQIANIDVRSHWREPNLSCRVPAASQARSTTRTGTYRRINQALNVPRLPTQEQVLLLYKRYNRSRKTFPQERYEIRTGTPYGVRLMSISLTVAIA